MGFVNNLPPMDLMRSEKMAFVQLIIPVETAHRAVSYLGELGLIQFRELNADKSPFQRTFVNQVKRCAEMSRKLRFFKDQIVKAGVVVPGLPTVQPQLELEELEVQLGEHEHELIEMNSNTEKLLRSYNELLEFRMVLQKAGEFLIPGNSAVSEEIELDENIHSNNDYVETSALLEQEMRGTQVQSGIRCISGIICKSKALKFERILFRATRGNLLFNQSPANVHIQDPTSSEMVEKTVFVVFFSGERARTKILKICEAFGANCYPVPDEISQQRQISKEVVSRLAELEATLDVGIRHRNKALSDFSINLTEWMNLVRREKAVYDTLNMLNFDVTKKCLVGEGWCPLSAKAQIQEALERATFHSNSQVGIIFHVMDAVESPPTYFRTNRFTNAYQEIVDAYGVGRYQEANPAVYAVVTFPFLFAVMFGDWGHGICLLLLALSLIARESKYSSQKLGSFMELLFGGRYIIFLMSLFSIYCGLIYNEFFSVPFHIFGPSAYRCRETTCSDSHTAGLVKFRDPYPFGIDPSWYGSRSELPFLNSLKMKMSILLGIAQMNLGIILSYFNARFFNSSLDIRYQFIPQIIFLNSLFGYLSLLIVLKWCTGSKADLYHVMIYMFLSPFDDLGENELFWGQRPLQILLLLLAIVAVPWMLFPKPFILKKLHSEISLHAAKAGVTFGAVYIYLIHLAILALLSVIIFIIQRFQGRTYGILRNSEVDIDTDLDSSREHHEDFNFSEVFVHQLIHSIEFVLGAVSNTASYLRLWALSLAHSELSTVFYEKVLLLAWGYDNLIIRLVGLAVFAFATAFILLMMETLSAFLHALRLHWVEYQNKFYHGDGYKFKPFSFALLTDDED